MSISRFLLKLLVELLFHLSFLLFFFGLVRFDLLKLVAETFIRFLLGLIRTFFFRILSCRSLTHVMVLACLFDNLFFFDSVLVEQVFIELLLLLVNLRLLYVVKLLKGLGDFLALVFGFLLPVILSFPKSLIMEIRVSFTLVKWGSVAYCLTHILF